MLKLSLVVLAIPLVLVASVRLALRVLRFVRAHRDELTFGWAVDEARSALGDALERWADDGLTAGLEHEHSESAYEHHHHDSGH